MKNIEIGLREIQKIETYMVLKITTICEKNNIPIVLTGGSAIGAVRHGGNIPWDDDVDMCVPIIYMEKTIEALIRELPKFLSVEYFPKCKQYNLLFPRVVVRGALHYTLHVDIFPIIGAPSEKILQESFWKSITKTTISFSRKQLKGYPWEGFAKKTLRKVASYFIIKANSQIAQEFESLCKKYDYSTAEYIVNPCGKYGIKEFIPKEYFEGVQKMKYNSGFAYVPQNYHQFLGCIYGDYMQLPDKNEQHQKDDIKVSIPYDSYMELINMNALNCIKEE